MWYDRKDISKEEADKENKRMFALEDRDDDDFDLARINDMTSADDIDVLKDIDDFNKNKGK